jgi:hypothetical protein
MPGLILRESLAAIKRVRGETRFRRRLRKFSATPALLQSVEQPLIVSHPQVEAERARSSHARIASGPHPVDFSGLPVGGDYRDEVTAIDSPARGCTACGGD